MTLKLICLNSIISKYESLSYNEEDDADSAEGSRGTVSTLGLFSFELNRIEDILAEFFENCELGRSGYLLVNPIRNQASVLLSQFQQFISGNVLYKKRHDPSLTVDDLATLPQIVYRSQNARRSHSVNCIGDFKKFASEEFEVAAVPSMELVPWHELL